MVNISKAPTTETLVMARLPLMRFNYGGRSMEAYRFGKNKWVWKLSRAPLSPKLGYAVEQLYKAEKGE